LPSATKAEIAARIDKAVPVDLRRTRSLAEQFIQETSDPSP
jgi:hypothetical protein